LKEKSTTKAKGLQTNLKEISKENRPNCSKRLINRKRSSTKKNKKLKISKSNKRNLSKRLYNKRS